MTGVGAGENQIELGGGYSQRDQAKLIEKEDKFDGLVRTKTFTRQLDENQSEIEAGIDQEMFNF